MKRLFYLLLVLTIVVGSIAPSQGNAKAVIGSYTWTDNCKCLQVGPSFAYYVPVSNCKGLPSTHGCK
jgi:hypothetical protein